jgi:hypothetical protein
MAASALGIEFDWLESEIAGPKADRELARSSENPHRSRAGVQILSANLQPRVNEPAMPTTFPIRI